VIVTLMHDILNRAEKTLARSDSRGDMTTIRHLYKQTMQADFTEAGERLTRRTVIALITGNHVDPTSPHKSVMDAPS
jgi:hypothetical protein